jgi:hypothetical protein
MDSYRAIAPGIVQLVAPVGHKDDIHGDFAGSFVEAAGLVSQLAGKN